MKKVKHGNEFLKGGPGRIARPILMILLLAAVLPCQAAPKNSAPFALAPAGQFGGAFTGEFDRRFLLEELVYVRRAALRMGWSPLKQITLWGEGGIASLELFEGDRRLQGAFGPAFGAGWSLLWPKPLWKGWTPFISGRGTYFQSKLSDDQYQGASVRSRRSRFEWTEVVGIYGATRNWKWGSIEAGLETRLLLQDEFRTFRIGSNSQEQQYTYAGGIQPGMVLGATIKLPHRLTLFVLGESSTSFQKVTITVGQWGRL